jgi:hypothetical protein
MPTTVAQRAFSAGEIAPALQARADLKAYATGLALCRNCFIRREGGVMNRAGTKYLRTAGDPTQRVRILPFIFEAADQTYLLEFGATYIRFYWHGAIVLSGMSPYQVTTPYAAADLAELQFAQSADVLTLTHPSYPPKELRRHAHTNWTLDAITTAPSTAQPTGLAASAGGAGSTTMRYVITAAAPTTYEESIASAVVTLAASALPTQAAPNTLSWTNPGGVAEWYVYADPFQNGLFGFIGTARSNSFTDAGFAPDLTVTPPVNRVLFNATGAYPAVSAYYQQRRWFARTNTQPLRVWGSRIGAYSNFSISTPLQDDDAIEFELASLELNPVHHLLSLARLLLLTDRGEWVVHGDDTGAITPTAINPEQPGFVGSHKTVRPVGVGNRIVYAQARGAALRELDFTVQPTTSLGSTDLTTAASHLFKGHHIVAIAFQQEPHAILWAVRDDGVLLGCTYNRDEGVLAWSQHDTGASGLVEDVCVLPDTTAGEDVLYLVVKRTINGSPTRYLERLASRFVNPTNVAGTAFFVDAGGTYIGAPATTITGLDHLEGEVVAVLADGVVVYDGDPDGADAATFTVSSGQIVLPAAASVVHAGLPIRFAEIETLAIDLPDAPKVRDQRKLVPSATVIVQQSDPLFLVGPGHGHAHTRAARTLAGRLDRDR